MTVLLSTFLEPAGFTGFAAYGKERGSNGLTCDHLGRLLSCEHGDRRVSLLEKDGGKRTVADAWKGKRLNSPNDLVVHSSGDDQDELIPMPELIKELDKYK